MPTPTDFIAFCEKVGGKPLTPQQRLLATALAESPAREIYKQIHRSIRTDSERHAESIRTDSERYAELRKLVEYWQKNLEQAHKNALIQWKHR